MSPVPIFHYSYVHPRVSLIFIQQSIPCNVHKVLVSISILPKIRGVFSPSVRYLLSPWQPFMWLIKCSLHGTLGLLQITAAFPPFNFVPLQTFTFAITCPRFCVPLTAREMRNADCLENFYSGLPYLIY